MIINNQTEPVRQAAGPLAEGKAVKYTNEQLDNLMEWLISHVETHDGMSEILHEFEVVRSIVANNNAVEWLDGLAEELTTMKRDAEHDEESN